ncbi:MAG TPA: sigma-54 dependent transcriptional regulator [Methylomirabilota bacterium]|nr:sigma-54 dependent transcriptional regulator [Methylomirabilota bacterium]
MMPRVLVVDDEPMMRKSLAETIRRYGAEVMVAANGEEALQQLRATPARLIFCDVRMPQMDGLEFLRAVRSQLPQAQVVMITAFGSVETAVEAMKEGADDFLLKPFSADRVEAILDRALQGCGQADRIAESGLITQDPKLKAILTMAERVASTDATVLIEGESGTGKELFARALHGWSQRGTGPFVAVNCAALPEALLESELFGHEKGSFTGAIARRIGRFEAAHQGTLLLDEISEIPLGLQAKLLRVLQEHEVDRVGGSRPVKVDVRVIATTNRALRQEVMEGRFRQDLFYRLNVIHFQLPPLRDRAGDIPLLAQHFLERYAELHGSQVGELAPETTELLLKYHWPGNIRELENAVQRAVILCSGRQLTPKQLVLDDTQLSKPGVIQVGRTFSEMEREFILETLKRASGNRTQAAKILGLSVRTIRNKLREYRVEI